MKALKPLGDGATKAAVIAAALAAIAAHKAKWAKAILAIHRGAATESSQGLLDALPGDFPLPDDFSHDSGDDDQLGDWADASADSISSTNSDRIKDAILAAAEGALLANYLSAIQSSYDTWQGAQDGGDPQASRSSVIAGDATAAGWNFGESDISITLSTTLDSVSMENEWNTLEDDRVRPTHADAQGQTQAPGDPFEVGDALLLFPCDPNGPIEETANCRCFTFLSVTYPGQGDDTSDEKRARRLRKLARVHRREQFRAFMTIPA